MLRFAALVIHNAVMTFVASHNTIMVLIIPFLVTKVCGISGQEEWKFQLCISQTGQADRATGNDGIFASISADYATTASCPQGRLSRNYTNNSKWFLLRAC